MQKQKFLSPLLVGSPLVVSRPFPLWFAAGVKYLIKAILHNNLAGHGPDSGEEDMLFLVSKERYGADTTDLKAEKWQVQMHQQWDFLDL